LVRRPLAQGSFLATCGSNRIVNVFNRQGEEHAEIPLDGNGRCTGLEWDKDGEMLAVMQEKSAVIKLWDANQNAESSLDTGLKEELSLIRWSASGPQLAIGTAKGAPQAARTRRSSHAYGCCSASGWWQQPHRPCCASTPAGVFARSAWRQNCPRTWRTVTLC
jgi:WD40 repeat protein